MIAELKVTHTEMREVWSQAVRLVESASRVKSGGRQAEFYILKFKEEKDCEDFAMAISGLTEVVYDNAKAIMTRAGEAPTKD